MVVRRGGRRRYPDRHILACKCLLCGVIRAQPQQVPKASARSVARPSGTRREKQRVRSHTACGTILRWTAIGQPRVTFWQNRPRQSRESNTMYPSSVADLYFIFPVLRLATRFASLLLKGILRNHECKWSVRHENTQRTDSRVTVAVNILPRLEAAI